MIKFKTGDTLSIDCVRKDASGTVVDLSNQSIKCEMADSAGSLTELTSAITDAENGAFTLALTAAQTDALTPGSYTADIQFTEGDTVQSTKTFYILMVEDVTSA